jgi:hypothetical protein
VNFELHVDCGIFVEEGGLGPLGDGELIEVLRVRRKRGVVFGELADGVAAGQGTVQTGDRRERRGAVWKQGVSFVGLSTLSG